MVTGHERNQIFAQLLKPGAPTHESLPRKAFSAARRLHKFNWLALGFFVACLAIAWIAW